MNKTKYCPPQMREVQADTEEMVAQSPGLNYKVGNGEQLVKGVDLPMGPEGKDVVNRSLWDDEW